MSTFKISYPGDRYNLEIDGQFRKIIEERCNYESFDTEFGFGNREIVVGISSIEDAVKLKRELSSSAISAQFPFVFSCECSDLQNYMQCCDCKYWWNAHEQWTEELVCPECGSPDLGSC